MKLIRHKAPLFAATLMILCSTGAYAEETTGSASGNSGGVLGKVEHALGVAAKATEHGVKTGAQATGHGLKVGMEATAHGIERGAEWTDRTAHKVADKISGSSNSSSGK